MKVKTLMKLLKVGAFGELQAWLYAFEVQKRGLPHVHALLWLSPQSRINPDNIDGVVSAEIPCPIGEPALNDLVKSNMIHGPCGLWNNNSPCMKDRHCTKSFPKKFRDVTEQGNDGYPKYRRRDPESGGNTVSITLSTDEKS